MRCQLAPPFLLTYADKDMYLMPEQAHIFYNAFVKRKLNARLVLTSDRTHLNALSGVGQPVVLLAQDVLGLEMVRFATDVAGATPDSSRLQLHQPLIAVPTDLGLQRKGRHMSRCTR